jgi:hypothetical protein
MANLGRIVRELQAQRDRAQREVERLNAALTALGNLGVGTEDQSEFWPEKENLCRRLFVEKSPRSARPLGKMEGHPEGVKISVYER